MKKALKALKKGEKFVYDGRIYTVVDKYDSYWSIEGVEKYLQAEYEKRVAISGLTDIITVIKIVERFYESLSEKKYEVLSDTPLSDDNYIKEFAKAEAKYFPGKAEELLEERIDAVEKEICKLFDLLMLAEKEIRILVDMLSTASAEITKYSKAEQQAE